MMRPLVFACCFAVTSAANAQTRALSDSVMALNRAGLWEQAGQLAQRTLRSTNDATERCALLADGAYALAQLVRLDAAKSTLQTFDRDCASNPIAQQHAVDLRFIRSAIDLPPLPTTGIELTALDRFWTITDLLRRDVEPSAEQWRGLLTTVTYRMVLQQNPNFR